MLNRYIGEELENLTLIQEQTVFRIVHHGAYRHFHHETATSGLGSATKAV
jgi:hypothetical protein